MVRRVPNVYRRGTPLATRLVFEDEIKARLGIPAEVETAAVLPIGYPAGRFGPTARSAWTLPDGGRPRPCYLGAS